MFELSSDARKEELLKATPAQKEARDRMALFPIAKGGHGGDGQGGARSELIFVAEDKWVPVLRLGGKVCSPPALILILIAALCVPGDSELVSTAFVGLDSLLASSTRIFQAFPSSYLYKVSPSTYRTGNMFDFLNTSSHTSYI
jgi:hypothetical protein